jgi:DNA invertase Pin-like site-specific DNA recombinase
MAMVGYARVSSVGQSLDVQLDQLNAAGCEKVFAEKMSGTTTDGRDQLAEALDWVRDGDVLVVSRLDRLARSIIDLRKIIDRLSAKSVGFRCLQQGAIDTTRSDGRLLLNILASFAEFETDIRKERQADGIAKAKSEGKYQGRPATIDPDAIATLESEGLGASAIAKRLGIGRASVYRLKNERKFLAAKTRRRFVPQAR